MSPMGAFSIQAMQAGQSTQAMGGGGGPASGIQAIEGRIRQLEAKIQAFEGRIAQLPPASPVGSPAALQPSVPAFQSVLSTKGWNPNAALTQLSEEGVSATQPGVPTPVSERFSSTAEAARVTTPQNPFAAALNPKSQLSPVIDSLSQKYGVESALIHALVEQESGFNPKAVSSAGAQGLMQLMPGTAKELGVSNPMDPVQNLDGGIRYFKQQLQRFHGNVPLALAAYNAGPGAVNQHHGIPPYPETQHYVKSVLGKYLSAKNAS